LWAGSGAKFTEVFSGQLSSFKCKVIGAPFNPIEVRAEIVSLSRDTTTIGSTAVSATFHARLIMAIGPYD